MALDKAPNVLARLWTLLLHPPQGGAERLNLRRWFAFFVFLLVGLTLVAMLSFSRYAALNDPWAQRVWLMSLYLFYMSLCCTFVPAPTAWIVLLMASPYFALLQPLRHEAALSDGQSGVLAAMTIVLVGGIGALGTTLANLNEYHIWTFLLRFRGVERVRHARLYQTASRWFQVSPFALMTLVNFLPIPVDVVRWLAISNRYRRDHYALACFVGRFVRYGLFAATAFYLKLSLQTIMLIQAGLIGLLLLRFLPQFHRQTKMQPEPAAVEK